MSLTTLTTCNLMGGLGNQLFQIFTTMSYAFESNRKFFFKYSEMLDKRITYWDTFLNNIKQFTVINYPQSQYIQLHESPNFLYSPIPHMIDAKESILLYGYFQSYKYFEKYYHHICCIIKLYEQKQNIKVEFSEIAFENTCSMHFRIGDYKTVPDCHPILSYDYYERSIQYILTNRKKEANTTNDDLSDVHLNILYFCEKVDNEEVLIKINRLQNVFPNCKFIKVEDTITEWKQLLIMSLCSHNIIANSTFSWWGAYFNDDTNKIVCYSDIWFGPVYHFKIMDDLCPVKWIKIHN